MSEARSIDASINEQFRILLRGVEAAYTAQELRNRLEASRLAGRPLRIKLGLDPTAPDIHLGHTVVLRKLRQFQDCGHKAVLIIGDYTARIGDPSGRTKTRPVLTDAEIRHNADTYFQQAGRVLDTSPDKLEVRYNSEWLAPLDLAAILRLMGHMTVQQMLQRENFAQRLDAETPIVLTELVYPLMQAYDSVMIDADVELGGTDQTFNNLVGRDLMPAYGKRGQIVMVMPLLRGLDGHEKMSKSLGNYVGVTFPPKEMFGKTMSIPDDRMREWFTLLTDLADEEIAALCDPGRTHPRDAKVRLAKLLVTQYHDAAAADREEQLWQKVMVEGGLRDDVPVVEVARSECDAQGRIWLPKLMKLLDLVPSTSEGRRLIQGGGVLVDQQKVSDPQASVAMRDDLLVQIGKRRAARVKVK